MHARQLEDHVPTDHLELANNVQHSPEYVDLYIQKMLQTNLHEKQAKFLPELLQSPESIPFFAFPSWVFPFLHVV